MEKKYKITIRYIDGSTEIRVGVDKPLKSGNEILIKSPDGGEAVVITDNVKSFFIEEYKD